MNETAEEEMEAVPKSLGLNRLEGSAGSVGCLDQVSVSCYSEGILLKCLTCFIEMATHSSVSFF